MILVVALITLALTYGVQTFPCAFYPKVILHKDINKTIMAEDPVGDKTIDDVIIHTLAEQCYDCWDERVKHPISYSKYIKAFVHPGNKCDLALKKLRNQKISNFIEYLQSSNNNIYPFINERYQKLRNKICNNTSIIFTSFYREIEFLEYNKRPYSIVLRTFGKDLDRIIDEIHKNIRSDFFSWRGIFKNGVLELRSLISNEIKNLRTTQEFYEFLKDDHGNVAVQDDWKTWSNNGEKQEFGKLFPVDCNDQSVITYFADDNADPQDGILNPRHPNTNAVLNVNELIKSKHICVADMLKAIEDDEYYVRHLKCLLHNCINEN